MAKALSPNAEPACTAGMRSGAVAGMKYRTGWLNKFGVLGRLGQPPFPPDGILEAECVYCSSTIQYAIVQPDSDAGLPAKAWHTGMPGSEGTMERSADAEEAVAEAALTRGGQSFHAHARAGVKEGEKPFACRN